MSIEVFKGTAKVVNGLKIECSSRNHKIVMDEPKNLGGTDTGMNPVEAVLCALGACKCIVAQSFAKFKRIDLQDFWVEVEGDLDPAGFQGKDKNVKVGLQNIRSNIHIKSSSSKEDIEKIIEFIDRTCPVADTLVNPANLATNITIEE